MNNRRLLRILYLIGSLDLGGAEQVVLHLAQGLDRKRFFPVVGCLHEKGRFASRLEEARIPVFVFSKRPKIDLALIGRLRYFLRETSVDLVHTHLFTANLWGRLAGAFSKIPVVVTEHSVDAWKGWPFHLLDLGLKPFTTHWIFVSEEVRRFYEGRLGTLRNASVITNGVSLASSLPVRRENRLTTLAAVGRLAPEKGLDRFVKLIARLHREGLAVRGLLVGDGPQRIVLEQAVAHEGLTGKMEFTGFVTEMEKVWPLIDVLCLTSSREGLPLSALEAMGFRIPVLATDVGGVKECIQDGVEGYVVPFGDWEGFFQRARALVQDPSLREKLGTLGRARIERQFNLPQTVGEHEKLYERLLFKTPRG